MAVNTDARKTGVPGDERETLAPRIVLFGDSFTEYENYTPGNVHANTRAAMDAGCWHYLLAMIGYHRFEIAKYAGVSGNRASDMLARFASDAAAYDYDILLGQVGVNDFFGYDRTVAEVSADVTAMISAALAAGKRVAWATCCTQRTTRTGWTLAKQKKVLEYNKRLTDWATGKKGLVLLDMQRPLMNQTDTTNAAPVNENLSSTDAIHLSGLGSYLFARDNYEALNSLFPPRIRQFTPLDGLDDGWSNSVLPVGVGAMAGTSGTLGTGASGAVATGWVLQRTSSGSATGSATVAGSKTTDRNGDWQKLTVTGDDTTTETQIELRTATFHSAVAAGDTIKASAELKVDVSGGLTLSMLRLMVFLTDGSFVCNSEWNRVTSGAPVLAYDREETFSIETPSVVIPEGVTGAYVYLTTRYHGSGTADVSIRNVHALRND